MNGEVIRRTISLVCHVLVLIVLIIFAAVYVSQVHRDVSEPIVPHEDTVHDDQLVHEDHMHHPAVHLKADRDLQGNSTISDVSENIDQLTLNQADAELDTMVPPLTDDTGSTADVDYKLRLNADGNSSSGRLYIEHGGELGFVCTDGFDDRDAQVVCRELGFKKGLSYKTRSRSPLSHYTQYSPMLSYLHCTGQETRLSECSGFRLVNGSSCTWYAAVICFDVKPYELRLITGPYPNSGLVEMNVGGEWRLFCAIHNFNDELADILCRNMNYTGGFTMERGIMGAGNHTKVWAPYVMCPEGPDVKHNIFECTMTLHTENLVHDYFEFRNNRYKYEYMSCLSKTNSYAATVQCLK